MNEEEKKVVEYIRKEFIEDYRRKQQRINKDAFQIYVDKEDIDNLETILNLIEKQQKGIEIHKENFKSLSEDITQVLKELGLSEETIIADEMVIEIKKRFVSKEKIKEIHKNTDNKFDFTEQILKLVGE